MLRLTAPQHSRLHAAATLDVSLGGAELNVAVALANLGVSTEWVSALPDNPLGRRVVDELRRHGVDTGHVVWKPEARLGLYFLEEGAYPRPSQVLYDRQGSAITRMVEGDVDWGEALRDARVLHVTGITPALCDSCRQRTEEAVRAAGAAGVKVSLDTNYRSKLWSPAEAQECLEALLGDVNLLFTSPSDLEAVFGRSGAPEDMAAELRSRYSLEAVALSLRVPGSAQGRLCRQSLLLTDRLWASEAVEHDVVDALGAGDAFTAGVLYGWLQGDPLLGLRMGDTLAAMKQTVPGDLADFTLAEVEAVMSAPSARVHR
jgi:2-dehydro-3-deoxygluconokinase